MYILSFIIFAIIAMTVAGLVTLYWFVRHRQLRSRMKELSQEIAKANNETKAARQVKDIFFQNMSHQIRTPLHAINGFAELLAMSDSGFSDEEKKEFASHIKSNATMITMLFDDMLSIVDIDCGTFDISIAPASVNAMVREVMATLRHMTNPSVELSYETDIDDAFTIETDEHRVRQVLMNFLSNAINHTEKGFIKIGAELSEDGHDVVFSVTDSGCGVPKEMATVIFSRFKKLNDFKLGNGLGLSLCQMIADRLHSKCYLDTTYPDSQSEIDHGARFVFSTPVMAMANE